MDGETEHVDQEIETYLQIFCGSNPASWAQHITLAEFTHNHCPHSITNQSPFFLMMGYEPQALPTIIYKTSILTIQDCLNSLLAIRKEALTTHDLARQTMKAEPGGTSNHSKKDPRYGWKGEASNALFLIQNLLPSEKDLSSSQKSSLLSPINSDSHSHGKFTIHSTLPFSPLISKMTYTEGTSHLLHQILSIMKNIMKSKRFFDTKELHSTSST